MPKGKSYSFRNPPASKIDKKFGKGGKSGMKKMPSKPSNMKSSSKKKY